MRRCGGLQRAKEDRRKNEALAKAGEAYPVAAPLSNDMLQRLGPGEPRPSPHDLATRMFVAKAGPLTAAIGHTVAFRPRPEVTAAGFADDESRTRAFSSERRRSVARTHGPWAPARSAQPRAQLRVDLGPGEQVEVAHPQPHPLPLGGEGKSTARVGVSAQRTG